jgi:hypothetical protein
MSRGVAVFISNDTVVAKTGGVQTRAEQREEERESKR